MAEPYRARCHAEVDMSAKEFFAKMTLPRDGAFCVHFLLWCFVIVLLLCMVLLLLLCVGYSVCLFWFVFVCCCLRLCCCFLCCCCIGVLSCCVHDVCTEIGPDYYSFSSTLDQWVRSNYHLMLTCVVACCLRCLTFVMVLLSIRCISIPMAGR